MCAALSARGPARRAQRSGCMLAALSQEELLANQDLEVLEVKRLVEERVGAIDRRGQMVDLLADRAQHDDPAAAGLGVALERARHLPPVSLRHHDVEHDEIGKLRAGHRQRGLAVAGRQDPEAEPPEPGLEQGQDLRGVIHDQDGPGLARSVRAAAVTSAARAAVTAATTTAASPRCVAHRPSLRAGRERYVDRRAFRLRSLMMIHASRHPHPGQGTLRAAVVEPGSDAAGEAPSLRHRSRRGGVRRGVDLRRCE